MKDTPSEPLKFCGGCGQLQPDDAERDLIENRDGTHSDPPIYECKNCASHNDKNPDIVGFFFTEDAEKLRCL